MTKFCGRCKEEKSVSDFSKDRSRKDGLRNRCKDCAREYLRKYREKNREKVREWDRNYKKENREKAREWERKYEEKNRDYYASKSREHWRKKNRISAAMATKSGRWSQEEVDLLVELRKTRTVYQCSIELGRGYASTQKKITHLRKKGIEI